MDIRRNSLEPSFLRMMNDTRSHFQRLMLVVIILFEEREVALKKYHTIPYNFLQDMDVTILWIYIQKTTDMNGWKVKWRLFKLK